MGIYQSYHCSPMYFFHPHDADLPVSIQLIMCLLILEHFMIYKDCLTANFDRLAQRVSAPLNHFYGYGMMTYTTNII